MSRNSRQSARHPQHPASPNKHVAFDESLISGPSGRPLQPTQASVSGDSEEDYNSDAMDTHQRQDGPARQLRGDFARTVDAAEQDQSPKNESEFWNKLEPGGPFLEGPGSFQALSDTQKDYRVCQGMKFLIDEIQTYAESRAGHDIKGHNFMNGLLANENNKELIRYIGCIAIGGKKGEKGWNSLLTKNESRTALVIGIIGRLLEEHVFSALYFGGSEELVERLSKMEQDQVNDEGFMRTEKRGKAIFKSPACRNVSVLEKHVTKVTSDLAFMLDPLCQSRRVDVEVDKKLWSIVYHAGQLSRMMRIATDVVYYWPPTFKDEEFEPSRMEALNLIDMITKSPYKREKVNGHERAILNEGKEEQSEAIVRVVCFPGLVAYRRHGGALAEREIEAEKQRGLQVPEDVQTQHRRRGEQPLTPNQGIRSKVICKSRVLLEWGQQRLLTKEAGTSAHIDAVRDDKLGKYEDDYQGFVELYDLAKEKWKKN